MRDVLSIVCLSLMMTTSHVWSQPKSAPGKEQVPAYENSGARNGVKKQTPENPAFDPMARRAQRLADDLKSPFCPGKTLKTCTSPDAAKVRRDIQRMVRDGASDEAIVAALKMSYDTDEFSVANPDQPAYTIFVPFIPFVILTGAMIFMIWLMRRRTRNQTIASEVLSPDTDPKAASRSALRARLQADDKEF